jgi:tetratricopeptide (TPR) repeat protein
MSKALLLLSIAEKQQGRCDACQVLTLQIFDALKRVDDLCALCTDILLKHSCDEQWLRVVHTLFLHSLYKQELLAVFDAVVHEKRGSQRLLLYGLDCALRVNDYHRIVTYYKKLHFKRSDLFLKALVLYQVGACAYEQGDTGLVRSIARETFSQRYVYAPLLNFAAYYYSKYEKAYDKAQVLLDEALRLDPENPHFKDTQAYIYLRSGNKEKAVKMLQPLVYEAPLDRKIRHHRNKARYI